MNCNEDMFHSFMKNIDWEKMDAKLMIRQDPVTRANRKRFYQSIDSSKGGSLDAVELKAGILKLLVEPGGESLVPMGDELLPAVRCAFNASRNLEKHSKTGKTSYKVATGKKAKVGAKEFHAFLIAFKYYLQLLELFEFIDGQGEDNQKLSLRECHKAVFLLRDWGITEEELDEKFQGVDAWVSHMSFKDFAQWCIAESGSLGDLELDHSDADEVVEGKAIYDMQKEHGIEMRKAEHGVVARDSEENHETVQELFARWDSDKSGSLSRDELAEVLEACDPTLTAEQVNKLFVAADANKDGKLDINEFVKWILA